MVFKNIEEIIVHKPESQLKKLYFLLKINNIRCMSPKYKDIYCKYKLYGQDSITETEKGKDTNNPDVKHQRLISYDTVDSNVGFFLCFKQWKREVSFYFSIF